MILGQTGPTQTSAAPLIVYYWTNQLKFKMNCSSNKTESVLRKMEQKPWEVESFCVHCGSNGAPYCLIKYPGGLFPQLTPGPHLIAGQAGTINIPCSRKQGHQSASLGSEYTQFTCMHANAPRTTHTP